MLKTFIKGAFASLFIVILVGAQISTSSRANYIQVKATSYCLNGKNCPKGKYGGKTATGVLVGKGQIAVDPRIIPLGTVVEIIEPKEVKGFYVATDTGGKIKGKRIDIWLPSKYQAMNFGVKNAVLRVVKYPSRPNKNFNKKQMLPHIYLGSWWFGMRF